MIKESKYEEDEEELARVTPTFTKTDILRGPG